MWQLTKAIAKMKNELSTKDEIGVAAEIWL